MMAPTDLDLIAERVDRLLLRHDELKRVNHLLEQELTALRLERDQLRQQTQAVRQRLDALLARYPAHPDEAPTP